MKSKKILKYILIDILGYALGMGIFLLFFYLVPYELESENKVVGSVNDVSEHEFTLPSFDSANKDENETKPQPEKETEPETEKETEKETEPETEEETKKADKKPSKKPGSTNSHKNNYYGNADTDSFSGNDEDIKNLLDAEITSTILKTYNNDNVNITITKKEFGEGNDKVTYYVADIYVRTLEYFKTALAKDTYGTNIKEKIRSLASNNNAILAVTGDSYGNNSTGIVVRNGVLYRSTDNSADVCVLFTDGTIKTYAADEFDAEEIIEEGVWQAWSFGPALLDDDGEILDNFNTTNYLYDNHPRVAIGAVESGHYVLVVVDGREEGYSRGATISELAAIMSMENCTTAYNLDGGGSSSMVFDGDFINHATDRSISDIVCIIP